MASATPYTHVQANSNTTITSTSSRAQAFSFAVGSSNAIIGWIWLNDSALRATSIGVSDSASQTYTVTSKQVTSGGTFVFFWCLNAGANTPTITVSWTNACTTSPLCIHEYSGIPADFALDATAVSSHKTTGTAVTQSYTPAKNNAFVFAAMWNSGANSLTDPPTSAQTLQSHGLVTTSLYADCWLQTATPVATTMGFTVSSATEVSDVCVFALSLNEAPLVQTISAGGLSNTGTTATFVSNLTSGNIVVAIVGYLASGATLPTSVTCTHCGTFSLASSSINTTNSVGVAIYWAPVTSSGAATISTSFGSTLVSNLDAYEFNGNWNTLDQINNANYTSLVTSLPAGSITPTKNNALVVYALATITAITGNTWKPIAKMLAADTVILANGLASIGTYAAQGTAAAVNADITSNATRRGSVAVASFVFTAATGGKNLLMMMGAGA